MYKKIFLSISLIIFLLIRCVDKGFEEKANAQFGDQHFKTAIALVELYKIREGRYPPSLDSLKYLGDWDQLIFRSVEYKKLDEGYELNLTNGLDGMPKKIEYPEEFWKGLGLKKSNLRK